MDRGFTVEGLTVTYMPRSLGIGNADTIQQRARFLGYKRSYVGYCRVFLEQQVAAAYRRYVVHEENMRGQLEEIEREGKPLLDWRRAFFLDGALRPTRAEVLDLAYVHDIYSDSWFEPKSPHDSAAAIDQNRDVVRTFLESLDLTDDDGHGDRTETQRHGIARDLPLQLVYEQLLVPFRMTGQADLHGYLGLQLQVKAHLDAHPDTRCTVYQMSHGRERERGIADGKILQLFQGANYADGRRITVYPGDREIKVREQLTVQVHTLRLTQEGVPDISNVVALAVWVPRSMGEAWVVQTDEPV